MEEFVLQWTKSCKCFFQIFFPALTQHVVCDGMRKGLGRKVNGPVNNGASASLHSVSISESCGSQAPCRGDKRRELRQVRRSQGKGQTNRAEILLKNKSTAVSMNRRHDARGRSERFNVEGRSRSARSRGGARTLVTRSWRDANGLEAQSITFHPWAFRGSAHRERETSAHCCHLTFSTRNEQDKGFCFPD